MFSGIIRAARVTPAKISRGSSGPLLPRIASKRCRGGSRLGLVVVPLEIAEALIGYLPFQTKRNGCRLIPDWVLCKTKRCSSANAPKPAPHLSVPPRQLIRERFYLMATSQGVAH